MIVKMLLAWAVVVLLGVVALLCWYSDDLQHQLKACHADQSTPHE
jgi:hypothetical protein